MFATQQRQTENTRTVDISNQEVNIDEKTRMEREMKSSDVTELERINRTRQQSSEDKEVNTSVKQQVTTVHERTEVDESMKLLENYSGEIVNNIMKCGPNINLNSARNMVNTVLVDESVSRNVDGSQAIVVVGDRNVVRNVRLHNMINLVGDSSVYDCIASQVSDLISKKDSLLSASNTSAGSTLKGATLETEGSDVTDKSKAAMGSENVNKTDFEKQSEATSEFGAESTTSAGQSSRQESIFDFMQGAGGGGAIGLLLIVVLAIFGIIGYVIYKTVSTAGEAVTAVGDVAASAAAATTGMPVQNQQQRWGVLHYVVVVVVLGLTGLAIWMAIDMFRTPPPQAFTQKTCTARGCRPLEAFESQKPVPLERYVGGALLLVLLLLIIYRFTGGKPSPVMVGGGLGWPSFYELYLFAMTLAIIGVSAAFFVMEAPPNSR